MAIRKRKHLGITDKDLQRLAEQLKPGEWQKLGRILEVPNLETIEYDHRRDGLSEIGYQMLRKWCSIKPEKATKKKLIKRLNEIGRSDIPEKIGWDKLACRSTNSPFQNLNTITKVTIFIGIFFIFSFAVGFAIIKQEIRMQDHLLEIRQQLEEQQKQFCKKIEMQVPWTEKFLPLEKLYVDLEMYWISILNEEVKFPIKIENIFDTISGVNPLRILIEGKPGFGKTTVCLKLLNDWGTGKKYISSRFNLVFLFKMKFCEENDTIDNMLKSQCELLWIDGIDCMTCIRAFESKILLLLDGFDEANEACKRKFLPLIQKRKYPSMSVIVTDRKQTFHTRKTIEFSHFGIYQRSNENVNNIWDKKVLITGIPEDTIERVLKKYADPVFENCQTKIISIIDDKTNEIFRCPSLLILVGNILQEKSLNKPNSKTSLYKEFFNYVIKRNLIKENKIHSEEAVDLFSQSIDQPLIQNTVHTLEQFGLLALKYMCKNQLLFEENNLKYNNDSVILDSGFMIKVSKHHFHKQDNFYEPIHDSFVEFLAAFAMYKLFNEDQVRFNRKIELITREGLIPSDDSFFYVFLGGFMDVNAYLLFQSLKSLSVWFNIQNSCFRNILQEIQDVYTFYFKFEPLLEAFIPAYYYIHGNNIFESEIHSMIINYGIEKNLFKILHWYHQLPSNSFYSFYFLQIYMIEPTFLCTNFNIKIRDCIKCKKVQYVFNIPINEDFWKSFVDLFNAIESEKVFFEINIKNYFTRSCQSKSNNEEIYKNRWNNFNALQLLKKKNNNQEEIYKNRWNNFNVSSPFNFLYKELLIGLWKTKKIESLSVSIEGLEDIYILSSLTDLIEREKINEGVEVLISGGRLTSEEDIKSCNFIIGKLLNAIFSSHTLKEFIFNQFYCNCLPLLELKCLPESRKFSWKSVNVVGYLNISNNCKDENKKISVEQLVINVADNILLNESNNTNFVLHSQDKKVLHCSIDIFFKLAYDNWTKLNEIEELSLINHRNYPELYLFLLCDQLLFHAVLHLKKLQTLKLFVNHDKGQAIIFKKCLNEFFSLLNMKILEIFFYDFELFSYYVKLIHEGLAIKEYLKSPKICPNICQEEWKKIVRLQEISVWFVEKPDMDQLKDCEEIKTIQLMLQMKLLKHFCWQDLFHYSTIEKLVALFPPNKNFTIFYDLYGINSNSSLISQYFYRRMKIPHRYCIKFIG